MQEHISAACFFFRVKALQGMSSLLRHNCLSTSEPRPGMRGPFSGVCRASCSETCALGWGQSQSSTVSRTSSRRRSARVRNSRQRAGIATAGRTYLTRSVSARSPGRALSRHTQLRTATLARIGECRKNAEEIAENVQARAANRVAADAK